MRRGVPAKIGCKMAKVEFVAALFDRGLLLTEAARRWVQ